jgi:FkbM family methyltransferase
MLFRRSRPTPAAAPQPAPVAAPPADAGDPAALFALAYGRPPDDAERARLAEIAPAFDGDVLARLRAVIAGFDRQHLDTPLIVRFSERDIVYAPILGVELAIDRADTSFSVPIFRRWAEYERHVTRFLQGRVRPGMTFVDVGANLGYYTVLASTWVGPGGRVIAFEPGSENNRLILLSLARNGCANVTLHPLALAGGRGLAYYSTFVGPNGGFLPDREATLRSGGCLVVPTAALDELVAGPVDVLKLDVEGAEGLVLAGASRTIAEHRPLVVSEFSMEMLPRVSGCDPLGYLRTFTDLGYRLHLIEREGEGLRPIPDPAAFVASYGPPTRIEDLAFLPPGVG